MMSLLLQLPPAMMWSFGFSIIFNVPRRKIPACVMVGALSWISFQGCMYLGASQVFAGFIAACVVWLLSNICARLLKDTSTMFIIPGIISLVPGAGLYYTMLGLLGHEVDSLAHTASQTLLTAASIAAGLLVMGSITGVFILLTKNGDTQFTVFFLLFY